MPKPTFPYFDRQEAPLASQLQWLTFTHRSCAFSCPSLRHRTTCRCWRGVDDRCAAEGYGTQGVPRQDGPHLQRVAPRRWDCRQQAHQEPNSGQAHQRPHRAHQALEVACCSPCVRQAFTPVAHVHTHTLCVSLSLSCLSCVSHSSSFYHAALKSRRFCLWPPALRPMPSSHQVPLHMSLPSTSLSTIVAHSLFLWLQFETCAAAQRRTMTPRLRPRRRERSSATSSSACLWDFPVLDTLSRRSSHPRRMLPPSRSTSSSDHSSNVHGFR